jgi:hypothetical protein
MPLLTRGARPAALVACALIAVLTACGGSVADADNAGSRAERQPTPAPSPFCTASRANSEALGPLNTLVSTGAPVDRAELGRAVETVRRSGQDLVLVAPAEVRNDVQLTVDAVDVQLDALLANGGDGRAIARDPEVAERLGSPELTSATQRLTAYVNRTCGTTATQR